MPQVYFLKNLKLVGNEKNKIFNCRVSKTSKIFARVPAEVPAKISAKDRIPARIPATVLSGGNRWSVDLFKFLLFFADSDFLGFLQSSTSLSGGNQVDGLPPVCSLVHRAKIWRS